MGTLTCLRGFARVAPYSDLAIHSLTLRIGCSDPTKRLVGNCYYVVVDALVCAELVVCQCDRNRIFIAV